MTNTGDKKTNEKDAVLCRHKECPFGAQCLFRHEESRKDDKVMRGVPPLLSMNEAKVGGRDATPEPESPLTPLGQFEEVEEFTGRPVSMLRTPPPLTMLPYWYPQPRPYPCMPYLVDCDSCSSAYQITPEATTEDGFYSDFGEYDCDFDRAPSTAYGDVEPFRPSTPPAPHRYRHNPYDLYTTYTYC